MPNSRTCSQSGRWDQWQSTGANTETRNGYSTSGTMRRRSVRAGPCPWGMKMREGSYDHSALAEKPGMHLVVAEASAMIDAADLLYWRSFRETIDKIMVGEPLTLEHRAHAQPPDQRGLRSRARSQPPKSASASTRVPRGPCSRPSKSRTGSIF